MEGVPRYTCFSTGVSKERKTIVYAHKGRFNFMTFILGQIPVLLQEKEDFIYE
jgi:hypothetical protein